MLPLEIYQSHLILLITAMLLFILLASRVALLFSIIHYSTSQTSTIMQSCQANTLTTSTSPEVINYAIVGTALL